MRTAIAGFGGWSLVLPGEQNFADNGQWPTTVERAISTGYNMNDTHLYDLPEEPSRLPRFGVEARLSIEAKEIT